MFGAVSPEQDLAMCDWVRGKVVYDWGAGDLKLAKMLALSARRIVAVEKEHGYVHSVIPPNIEEVRAYIKDVPVPPEGIDVSLVSWPVCHELVGLEERLRASALILYRGCNDGGTACGYPRLWRYLRTRTYLAGIAGRRNDVILFGAPCLPRALSELELTAWKYLDIAPETP